MCVCLWQVKKTLQWFELKGQKNIVWFGAKGQKKHCNGLGSKGKKTSLVFGRGVRFYRYIYEIVRGWCFLDKGRLFYEKNVSLYSLTKGFRSRGIWIYAWFLSYSRPIRFFGAWSSANQMISRSHSHPISFFGPGSSVNQVLSLSYSRPIRFFGAGSSAHQVLLLSHTGPIRFFRIGSSCNRVIFYWEWNQSGNFAIRLSSSQAFQAGSSVNRGLCGCDISHSGFFLGKRSANQLSWA